MTTRPGAMNLEARALADIILSEDRNVYKVSLEYERETAAQARAGGRELTEALALFGGLKVSREMMAEDPRQAWHYHIDPAGAYDWADPRREAEARERWASIAADRANGIGDWSRPMYRVDLTLSQAEAMLDWPIYRVGILAQQRDQLDATGHSTMRGLSSETLDILDKVTPWFAEPAYVEGFIRGAVNEEENRAFERKASTPGFGS